MTIRMTSLRRAPNGDWFARRMIPEDVREAYRVAFGVSQEARFRSRAGTREGQAKQEFRDWDAEIASRIERLRADARGEGLPTLTHRQAHALAGQWYVWMVGQHEEEPGDPEQWDLMADAYETAISQFSRGDEDDDSPRSPAVRRSVHRALTSLGRVEEFLQTHRMVLSGDAKAAFLNTLEGEFIAALATLRRRSGGAYRQDRRPEKFPKADRSVATPTTIPSSGLTAWSAFELWIEERKPASSSVNRWRAVFRALRDTFGDRDVASITTEEVQEWVDGLTTEERSAAVVQDVWLRAARTVLQWAVTRKRITINPFSGATVAVPRRAPKLREREFHEEEWRTILKATLHPPPPRMEPYNAAARRWVAWICAYTGSRPGEACQLRGEDVQETPHGWVMRITPEAGDVKGNVARTVPLHEHLIEQGFIAFAQAKGKGPLFYDPEARRKVDDDPTNPTRRPWAKSRDKLSEWVRALGVTDPGISPNHAWRHTFKRIAARAGIERRIRFAFCGHVSGDEGDRYETPSVEDMAVEGRRFPRYTLP
jgi:integrase